jgi:hypothetical protein
MSNDPQRYNVLMILTDQLRSPRFAYGPGGGFLQPIKDIVGFADGVSRDSEYADMFPGLMALRQNAVVPRLHQRGRPPAARASAARPPGQQAGLPVRLRVQARPGPGRERRLPGDGAGGPHPLPDNAASMQAFEIYLQRVEDVRDGKLVANPKHASGVERLRPGAVVEPNHVRCLRTREWKLVRYFDPRGNQGDQWELYSLRHDALEMHNLLVYDGAFPTVVAPERFPNGLDLSPEQVAAQARRLHQKLTQAEQDMLAPVAPQIASE